MAFRYVVCETGYVVLWCGLKPAMRYVDFRVSWVVFKLSCQIELPVVPVLGILTGAVK